MSEEEILENYKKRFVVSNIFELVSVIRNINYSINDDYYRKIVNKIFPNFNVIDELNDILAIIYPYISSEIGKDVNLANEDKLILLFKSKIKEFDDLVKEIFTNDKHSIVEKLLIIKLYRQLYHQDINIIYPNFDRFLFFYNKYKSIIPGDIFNNCSNYEDYSEILFKYITQFLEETLKNNNDRKYILEKRIQAAEIGKNDSQFYYFSSKITDLLSKVRPLESDKSFNSEIIQIKESQIQELEKQRDSYIEKLNNASLIYKILMKKSIMQEIEDLEKRIKDLREEIKRIEEDNKNIDVQIEKYNLEISSLKKEFQEKYSVSMDDYKKHYLHNKVSCDELKQCESELHKLNTQIIDNNNDLDEIYKLNEVHLKK